MLAAWRKDNAEGDLPNVDENPDAVAVQFFASYRGRDIHGEFPGTAADLQGVFFDAWLQEHRDAKLQPVPADMVMASGVRPGPAHHAAKRPFTDRSRRRRPLADRKPIGRACGSRSKPLLAMPRSSRSAGWPAGDALVNVLEVNLRLDRDCPRPGPVNHGGTMPGSPGRRGGRIE